MTRYAKTMSQALAEVQVRELKMNDPKLMKVKTLLDVEGISNSKKCNLNFTLAKIYEDLGILDKAFKHLCEGNRLRKNLLGYSIKLFNQPYWHRVYFFACKICK